MKADAARRLLETPDAQGLEELRKLWARTRSSEVADVLQAAADGYLAANPLPAPREKKAFHKAWLGLAKAPSVTDLTALAQRLTTMLPTAGRFERSDLGLTMRGLRARIAALGLLEPDPRLAAAICSALVSCTFALEHERELLDIFEHGFEQITSDARQAAVMQAALVLPTARAGVTRAILARLLPKLISACESVKSKLPASERAAWRALGARVAPSSSLPTQNEPQLLREILANEASDQPRLVYADALIERGEPRGDFISLQLNPSPLPELAKRQRALLKQHQASWLGPLNQIFTHQVMHRGFLHEAALAHNAKAVKSVWKQALAHPELQFVRRLRQGRGSVAAYLSFLDAPLCRGLTDIDLRSSEVLGRVLEREDRGYEGLELEGAPGLEGLRALLKFKNLRRLTISRVSDSQFAANLERSGLLERLEHLELDPGGADASLLALIGTGALKRVSFASFGSFFTVTAPSGKLVVEGESDFASTAEAVLTSVSHAERVTLAVTEYPASAARLEALEAWLRKNAEHHTFSRLKKTAGAAFHERVRLMFSTKRPTSL